MAKEKINYLVFNENGFYLGYGLMAKDAKEAVLKARKELGLVHITVKPLSEALAAISGPGQAK